jgi:hypothetical protein
MDITVDDGRAVMDAMQEETDATPPRMVAMHWLALTGGKPTTTYCLRKVDGAKTVWIVLGLQGRSLLVVEAEADRANWDMANDPGDGRVVRAGVHPIENLSQLSLHDAWDLDEASGDTFKIRSLWGLGLRVAPDEEWFYSIPTAKHRQVGWDDKVDEFIGAVRAARFGADR